MHQLQFREKSRAWTIMAMPDAQGVPRVIADRIQAGCRDRFIVASFKTCSVNACKQSDRG